MKTKALTAAQIDTLAQPLSKTPFEPATSAKTAGDTFARLLAARIGAERAALAFTSIMTADTADQAEARLTLVLDYGNPDPAGEPITTAVDQPKLTIPPVIGMSCCRFRGHEDKIVTNELESGYDETEVQP